LDQLKQLAATKDWESVTALARQLAETFPAPDDRARLGQQLKDLAQNLVKDRVNEAQLLAAAQRLHELEDRFPDVQGATPIDTYFRKEAEQLFASARADIEKNRAEDAVTKLNRAKRLFPRLPGLQDALLEQEGTYPILSVGVHQLPKYILP